MPTRQKKQPEMAPLDLFEGINIESSVPVYKQIKHLALFAIASGDVKPESRLPSVGDLSKKLEVNMNTVHKAYHELQLMGIVFSRRGTGVRVCRDATPKAQQLAREIVIAKLHEILCEAQAAGYTQADLKRITKKLLAADTRPYTPATNQILQLAKKA